MIRLYNNGNLNQCAVAWTNGGTTCGFMEEVSCGFEIITTYLHGGQSQSRVEIGT